MNALNERALRNNSHRLEEREGKEMNEGSHDRVTEDENGVKELQSNGDQFWDHLHLAVEEIVTLRLEEVTRSLLWLYYIARKHEMDMDVD